MFCSTCGTALAEAATVCSSCHAPLAAPRVNTGALQAAAHDAIAAVRALATNPVGGLAPAYEALGEARALRAGAVFGLVSLLCFLGGGYLALPPFLRSDLFEFLGFGGVMKCLTFALVPFACATLGSLGLRKAFSGGGGPGGDAFLAGAALLPASLAMLASGLLGLDHTRTVGALAVFALCTGTLMLFAGHTRITKLSERVGTIGGPLVVLLGVWLAKTLATSILTGGAGVGDAPFGYPF